MILHALFFLFPTVRKKKRLLRAECVISPLFAPFYPRLLSTLLCGANEGEALGVSGVPSAKYRSERQKTGEPFCKG